MSSILVVISWYLTGFFIAHRLIDAGHSPAMWWVIAALLGGAVAIPAVLAMIWRKRASPKVDLLLHPRSAPSGVHVMAMAPVRHLNDAIDAIPTPFAARADVVTIVGTVGHEAFCSGIDTGERGHAASIMRTHVRPCAVTDNRIVTSDGPRELERVFDTVGVPDVLVARPRPGRAATRRALEQALRLSATHDLPVLVATSRATNTSAREPSLTA